MYRLRTLSYGKNIFFPLNKSALRSLRTVNKSQTKRVLNVHSDYANVSGKCTFSNYKKSSITV